MTKSETLSGQVAVITGAGRGIGAAIAHKLAELGAVAVVCGRTRALLENTAAAIRDAGGQAEALVCDVSDLRSVETFAAAVERKFACVDILVNNAGVGGFGGPLHELPPESWEQVLNTNLRGVYYCIRRFAPMMIRARRGHIINISSLAGKNALPNGAAYAASKWGLNGLSYYYYVKYVLWCSGRQATEAAGAGPGTKQPLNLTTRPRQGPARSFFCGARFPE